MSVLSTISPVYVLGIDPGLANLGYAVVQLTREGCKLVWEKDVPMLGSLVTEKSAKKLGVKTSDDNTRRAREIYDPLKVVIANYSFRVLCVEAMSYPRNAMACHKMGISWGIIVALSCEYRLPIVQASPTEIKRAVCGKASASKAEVQAALATKHNVPINLFTRERREHPFDALGAVEACLDSEVMRVAQRLSF